MPRKVYNQVEGHRLLDNDVVCEDVTTVALPTIEHPTSTISAAGMAMDIDMPNMTHINAMEVSISHNNGLNCHLLAAPGKHSIETRVVRQRYDNETGTMGHESVKFRMIGMHKSTEKGSIETGNPYGSTEKYSVMRYEEEVNGEITTLIDAVSGIININGVDYTSEVESLLN